jgi:PepSY-associated TM region
VTGKDYDISFKWLILDPWTGKEIGRRNPEGDPSQGLVNLVPVIFERHRSMALGGTGVWVLGIVSLIWTLDCFTGFYLTLPVAIENFWRRWKPSWLMKWLASFFRVNFDLHQASGLWLWPMLFVFAWSSVMLDLIPVYDWVTGALFDYPSPMDEFMSWPPHPDEQPPKLDWRAAQATGARLMEEQALSHGFTCKQATGRAYLRGGIGVYTYSGLSSLDVLRGGDTAVFFRRRHWRTPETEFADRPAQWPYGEPLAQGAAFRRCLRIARLPHFRLRAGARDHHAVGDRRLHWKKRRARRFSALHRGEAAAARATLAGS